MRRTLIAGPVDARLAYRWLRRQAPDLGGDTYLTIRWPVDNPADALGPSWCPTEELPDATHDALWALDLAAKTLNWGSGRFEVRTRCWRRRAQPRVQQWPWNRHEHDRDLGLEYGRLIAALLRAAHRDGVALAIERTP